MRAIHQLDTLGDALHCEDPGKICTYAPPPPGHALKSAFTLRLLPFVWSFTAAMVTCVVAHLCCFKLVALVLLFVGCSIPKLLLLAPVSIWVVLFLLLFVLFDEFLYSVQLNQFQYVGQCFKPIHAHVALQ